ncbi:MAG: A24 family peptidase [Polyangiales bacterium]
MGLSVFAQVSLAVAVFIAAVAAFTDFRRGIIPNWLTLPPLVGAPIAYALALGMRPMMFSLIGILVCGLVPLVLFQQRAIGGGDVKLFAALGALLGPFDGLQVQLVAVLATALFSLCLLAWNGKLLRTLGNTFYMMLNPILPQAKRRQVSPELMETVRMGIPIFVATLIVSGLRWGAMALTG